MTWIKRIIYSILFLGLLFFLFNYLYPLNTARLHKPKSTSIYDNKQHLVSLKLSSDGFLRIPLKNEEISPDMKKILLAYEDKYFQQHFGINPLSILRALWSNLKNHQKIGASTITMQVARMMHHQPRTLSQKLIEMFQALQLELNYSKEEILTFYLNNAPYGGNIEGFASASFRYFNLKPSSLSLSQIAYLTSIPKNPNANRPKKNRNITNIKNKLLTRIYKLGLLSEIDYLRAKEEHISSSIKNLPHQIPHITAQINKEGDIFTTINMKLQKQIEKILYKEVEETKKFSIYNASVLVIENKSMNIVAYVGSSDFYDKQHGGQNDGVRAVVSPGSTLKPLVYAKALEEGLITPLKKIYDVPLFIDGYKPTNYAKEYLGEVTASEALQLSLNIPAVELDRLLHEKSLYFLLKQANIKTLTQAKKHYGSALTLGGWGISLKENAQLFAMLANGGIYQEASFFKNHSKKSKRILTKESSYLISNILADAPRLSFSSSWEYMKNMPRIAFKTGTSAHAKDMLTIGYTSKYTVAVWYGNFSGEASKHYQHTYATGLKIASPTLFKIFKKLGQQQWFIQPKGISSKMICQDSIQLKTCQKQIKDLTINNVSLQEPCQSMRAEVLSYLITHHKIENFKELKSHHCYEEWKSYKPLITNPIHHQKYAHNQYLPQALKKTMLQCYSFEENSTIYWLIDKRDPIIGQSSQAFYTYLEPSKHRVSCLDEGAKMQSIEFYVEEL
jgi:penicillin-binding protein 1C